jgi:hypothetical protein
VLAGRPLKRQDGVPEMSWSEGTAWQKARNALNAGGPGTDHRLREANVQDLRECLLAGELHWVRFSAGRVLRKTAPDRTVIRIPPLSCDF